MPPAGVPAFETDLPANVAEKRRRLRAIGGRVARGVGLVPVDFERDDLAAALAAAGFRIERPAMVVWEAVTQYLTGDPVRRTLAFLSRAPAGSRLIFTSIREDVLDGTDSYGAAQLYRDLVVEQRVWRFGLAPERAGDQLQEYGWSERGQVGRAELVRRSWAPAGRDLTVSEIERSVSADRD